MAAGGEGALFLMGAFTLFCSTASGLHSSMLGRLCDTPVGTGQRVLYKSVLRAHTASRSSPSSGACVPYYRRLRGSFVFDLEGFISSIPYDRSWIPCRCWGSLKSM